MKRFALFFAMQFVGYGLVTWNFRAIGKGWIGNAVMSDLLIAALGFTMISKVAEAKDHPARFGYILGGAAGSAFTILLTRFVWGS